MNFAGPLSWFESTLTGVRQQALPFSFSEAGSTA